MIIKFVSRKVILFTALVLAFVIHNLEKLQRANKIRGKAHLFLFKEFYIYPNVQGGLPFFPQYI